MDLVKKALSYSIQITYAFVLILAILIKIDIKFKNWEKNDYDKASILLNGGIAFTVFHFINHFGFCSKIVVESKKMNAPNNSVSDNILVNNC